MPINHVTFASQLGAELQTLRGFEAVWEWATLVGASYFRDKINTAYSNVIIEEDVAETESKSDLQNATAPAAASNHGARQSGFEDFFFAFMDIILGTSADDQASGSILYEYDATLIANGQVQISARKGRVGALHRQMTADAQTIRKNVVTLGALTAGAGNQGILAAAAPLGADHTLGGTLRFTIIDDTVGTVQATVDLVLTRALVSGALVRTADQPLRVGKAFQDGQTGFSGTLNLGSVVETGDNLAIFSVTSVADPSEADSAKGKHFFEVERIAVGGAGPHFILRWFRSGSLLVTDKVNEMTITGEAGTEVLTVRGSASTITTTFDKTAAVAGLPIVGNKDSDIVFDIKSPRLGDVWTIAVTNDETGLFATKLARRWPVALPSVANPGQTYDDTKATSLTIT